MKKVFLLIMVAGFSISCNQNDTEKTAKAAAVTDTTGCVNGILDSFKTSGVITSSISDGDGFYKQSLSFKYRGQDAVFYFKSNESVPDDYIVDSVTLIKLCDGSFSKPRTNPVSF